MFPNDGNQFDISQLSDEQLLNIINQNPELKKQLDLFSQQQQQQNIKKPQFKTKPLTDKEYLKLNEIKEYLDEEGGMMIEPTTHFVLKAFDHNGEKIFFNLTSHSVVDKPEEKQLVDYNNESGIRVPMSVGSIKEDHDVKGDICKVIDLVVNPEVAQNLSKDLNLRQFFCTLVQNYIFQKYKIKLQDKFINLKMKYKGQSVQFQRVKGKKPPKVEIIDETPNKEAENDQNNEDEEDETERIRKRQKEQYEKEILTQQNENQIQEPDWELVIGYKNGLEEEYEGDINLELIEYLRFEIQLPLLVTGRAIRIRSNHYQFQMTAGRLYKLQLRYPLEIDPNTIKAQFSKEQRILYLSAQMKIISKVEDTQQNEVNQKLNEIEQQSQSVKIQLDNNLIFDIV